ncbi:unnamed protein product [Rhizophagus irregularis]|nr:unnamed protein product [Rhizophagus irregularis]
MDICAHAPDSDSKASELYIGRDLIGSWTFARMLLTAIEGHRKASRKGLVGSWTFARRPLIACHDYITEELLMFTFQFFFCKKKIY